MQNLNSLTSAIRWCSYGAYLWGARVDIDIILEELKTKLFNSTWIQLLRVFTIFLINVVKYLCLIETNFPSGFFLFLMICNIILLEFYNVFFQDNFNLLMFLCSYTIIFSVLRIPFVNIKDGRRFQLWGVDGISVLYVGDPLANHSLHLRSRDPQSSMFLQMINATKGLFN